MKVSIVLLTHNNRNMLYQTLTTVLLLDWPDLEVIVVDNKSSDGTCDMLSEKFGSLVRVIRREVDSITAGRNEGFRCADGEIILSMDNDMLFHDKAIIRKAVALFKQFPDVGLLTPKITGQENPMEPLTEHWWHPVPYASGKDRFFYTTYFSEGALFVRKSVIESTGGYDDEFFGGFEGVDLALKMIQQGYKILYCPVLTCLEVQVRRSIEKGRSEWNYWFLRNKLWTVWKHYPVCRATVYSLPRIAFTAYQAIRYGWTDLFWKALKDGICAPRTIRAQRKPLTSAAWKEIRSTRQGLFCETEQIFTVPSEVPRICVH